MFYLVWEIKNKSYKTHNIYKRSYKREKLIHIESFSNFFVSVE